MTHHAATQPAKQTRIFATEPELANRLALVDELKRSPMPPDEIPRNLPVFLNRQALSQVLFMDHLYRQILSVHGSMLEFGVRWGRNLSLWTGLRGIHEPYNFNRKVVGFDTFAGFPSVDPKDGRDHEVRLGGQGVTDRYEERLEAILTAHENECPVAQVRKHELVKGDVLKTLPAYLERNPHTVVALAYFDLDLYEPTKACLELLKPRLTRGAVLGFDEANNEAWPGETLAIMETLGLTRYPLRRVPYVPGSSYMVIE